MRVLMISLDKGLVGGKVLGDVVERHKKYGDLVKDLDIIVFCKKDAGCEYREISANTHVYPTNSLNKAGYVKDALKMAREWFEKNKYDLVVTQDPYFTGKVGLELKKQFGVKLLVHFHGDFWGNPLALKERWYDIISLGLSKKVVSSADGVRVMSEGQRSSLIKWGVSQSVIRVISTPVNFDRFIRYPVNEQEKKQLEVLKELGSGKKLVLFVGRKDKVKDIETFFKAMRIVIQNLGRDNVGLYLVGDYTSNDVPEDLGEAVFSGMARTEHRDMAATYYRSALLVSTSLSESFGKVLVEANACARPVVATETAGAREIIQNGYNGFLVPIGDAKALAEKITTLLENPELARQMGENGRKLVLEKYQDNTERIIQFWKEIINK